MIGVGFLIGGITGVGGAVLFLLWHGFRGGCPWCAEALGLKGKGGRE